MILALAMIWAPYEIYIGCFEERHFSNYFIFLLAECFSGCSHRFDKQDISNMSKFMFHIIDLLYLLLTTKIIFTLQLRHQYVKMLTRL